MPLTVNVGLNRKASRDFQSAGVSINLSAELDMGLLGDPPRLQHEVAKVYAQASEPIDRQLASGRPKRHGRRRPVKKFPVNRSVAG
jgi:hypothetical protein